MDVIPFLCFGIIINSLDVNKWRHMERMFKQHVQKFFWIYEEKKWSAHTNKHYLRNIPFSSWFTPFIFPSSSSLFLSFITDSWRTTPFLKWEEESWMHESLVYRNSATEKESTFWRWCTFFSVYWSHLHIQSYNLIFSFAKGWNILFWNYGL